MEGDHSLCILCCYSFPLPTPSLKNPQSREKNDIVYKFIEQTGVLDLSTLSFTGLLGSRQVSFCPECLSGVAKVVDKREQVEEMKVNVRRLQLEILRMMRQLRGLMDGYLEEMRGLEVTIKQGDEGCLRGKLELKKEGTWTNKNVFQFRNGILNAVHELEEFQSDVSSKVLIEDKTVEAYHDEVECKVEVEAVPEKHDKLEETCDDGEGEETEDDSDWEWEKNEEEPEQVPIPSSSESRNKFYNPMAKKTCQFCNKSMTKSHFVEHEKYHCANNPKRRPLDEPCCVCHRCGKSFGYKKILREHLRVTCLATERNLKCELCGKEGFKTRQNLKKHEWKHSSERRLRPWMCALCGGDFSQKNYLRRHEKRCDGSKKPRRRRWSNMVPEIKKAGSGVIQENNCGDNYVR